MHVAAASHIGEPRRVYAAPPRRPVVVPTPPRQHTHGPRARDQAALAALLLLTAGLLIVAAFFLGVAAGSVFPSLRAVVSLSGGGGTAAATPVPDVAAAAPVPRQ